jgi:hypothetical protein
MSVLPAARKGGTSKTVETTDADARALRSSMNILLPRSFCLAFAALVSITGCVNMARYNERRADELRERVAFEMNCPAQRLVFTPLARGGGALHPELVTTYGVHGCGRRMVYMYVAGQWIANSSAGGEAPSRPRSRAGR